MVGCIWSFIASLTLSTASPQLLHRCFHSFHRSFATAFLNALSQLHHNLPAASHLSSQLPPSFRPHLLAHARSPSCLVPSGQSAGGPSSTQIPSSLQNVLAACPSWPQLPPSFRPHLLPSSRGTVLSSARRAKHRGAVAWRTASYSFPIASYDFFTASSPASPPAPQQFLTSCRRPVAPSCLWPPGQSTGGP